MMLIKDHQTNNNNLDLDDDQDDDDDDDDNEINPIQVIEDRPNTILSEKNTSHRRSMYGNDDDSDMDDFIVYDEDDENQNDQQQESMTRPRAYEHDAGPRDRKSGRRDGPSFEQLREANDIFGEGYDDFDDEEDDDDGDDDGARRDQGYDDDGDDYHARKPGSSKGDGDRAMSKKDKKRMEKLRSRFERSQLVNAFYTERDDTIRRIDKPERMQERLQGGETPQEEERAIEAKWMAMTLAAKMVADAYNHENSSKYYDFEQERRLREELEEPILTVLQFFHIEQYEVPFIWAYRRDYLHPSMTRAHLWHLFLMEEDWDKLYSMKRRLVREIRAIADAAEMTESGTDTEVQYSASLGCFYYNCLIVFNCSCFYFFYFYTRLLISNNSN